MKKIIFTINQYKKVQLVKGCPTDWSGDGFYGDDINGNGKDDDDFNHDGFYDQNDYDYYDGYINGWDQGDDYSAPDEDNDGEPDPQSDAYNEGVSAGQQDKAFDHNPTSDDWGPDINSPGEHFHGYY